jgi:hypothetical protein
MRRNRWVCLLALLSLLCVSPPAAGHVSLGTGNSGLLGGDLTDPEDDVGDRGSYGGDLPEEQLRPEKGNWVSMKAYPNNPPGTPAHQRHAYQSWQDAPACAVFLNKPEARKWYVGFKDGGYGGPTKDSPYYVAVQLPHATVLTHFTLTTSPDMPDRDPLTWVIQGSNTGQDNDWTDVYRCDAQDRQSSPLRDAPRCETTLFTSFTSAAMAKSVSPADAKKLTARLKGKAITKADFTRPAAYTWYRIAITSCFNPSSTEVPDPARPPGFALGQLELFGVPGTAAPVKKPSPASRPVGIEPAPFPFDPPFVISYCCCPPTTLERYKEVAECGFNVAWGGWSESGEKVTPANTRKILDYCKQAGIKALIFDDRISTAAKSPEREKALDGVMADFASHPALFGYMLADEPGKEVFSNLAAISQYLLKKDPKHLPYINLLPNYANHPDWLGPAYEPIVTKYISTVKPALLSWDHYRQMFGDNGDENWYWHNLEIVRRLCLQARIPYIQIIVSLKHMGYRECSEADLRWQVYTSLAYGSRGIIYFTYWDVPSLAWAGAGAIMTLDGKRDVKYEYVKKINHRIAKLGPTLVKLTSTGVYCTDPLPPGTRRLAAGAPVTKAEGGPLQIGCFIDRNAVEYVFVVNRAFNAQVVAKLTLDDRSASASEISQQTGKPLSPVSVAGKSLDVPLEPGEGRLYMLRAPEHASPAGSN